MERPEARMAELRQEIDGIDGQLIALFERRMDIARELGGIKRSRGLGIKNENREQEVAANCRRNCKQPQYRPYAEEMMQCIMGAARALQQADASREL